MKKRDTNVLSLLEDKTNDYARKTALGMKTNFGWRELTYDGLGLMARRLASYLINDLGIQKEEKMAIKYWVLVCLYRNNEIKTK